MCLYEKSNAFTHLNSYRGLKNDDLFQYIDLVGCSASNKVVPIIIL
jgi:hypothetical protein